MNWMTTALLKEARGDMHELLLEPVTSMSEVKKYYGVCKEGAAATRRDARPEGDGGGNKQFGDKCAWLPAYQSLPSLKPHSTSSQTAPSSSTTRERTLYEPERANIPEGDSSAANTFV